MTDDVALLELAESIVADEWAEILLKEEIPTLLARVLARLDRVEELDRDVGPAGLAVLVQARDSMLDFDVLGLVGQEGMAVLLKARDALVDFLTVVPE